MHPGVRPLDDALVMVGRARTGSYADVYHVAPGENPYELEIRLVVNDAAIKAIAAAGFDPVYGARPLKRAIQQQIENPLAKEILGGRYAGGDTVKVTASGGEIAFAKG